MTEQRVPPQVGDVYQQMTAMMTSHWVSQAVRAVADLSLADHLAAARLTTAEIAEREGSAPTTTFRLMRACVAIGLLTADANGRFGSTPLLQTLRKDTPGSLRDLALAITQPSQWLPLNEFVTSVRTGQSQVSAALGMDFFDYLEQHPSQAREFSAGVGSTTVLWAADAAEAIDTSGVKLAVDVGGATGSLLQLLQQANPELHGIVFDRPNIVDDAVAQIARMGLAERTAVVGGDFFESVPPADLYLLKFILHDWDDDEGHHDPAAVPGRDDPRRQGRDRGNGCGRTERPRFRSADGHQHARGQPGAGALPRGVRRASRRGRFAPDCRVDDQLTTNRHRGHRRVDRRTS